MKFLGHWTLTNWYATIDNRPPIYPFGKDAQGQLLYQENGWMYATLMRPDRPKFAKAGLAKGTPEEQKTAIEGYVAYSGTFNIEKQQVIHQVKFSLLPNWIGTELVRTFEFSDDFNQLTLRTLPEETSTGKIVVNHLFWQKNNHC